jgi:hypothetical protein
MSDVRENLSSPLPILVLVLVAVGLLVPRAPLQSPRPAESDRLNLVEAQSVPSRLWQDPMAAVELERDESGSTGDANRRGRAPDGAGLSSIKRDVERALGGTDDERLLILPVLFAATPFRDDAEERRRVRYAVVSGLLAKGFVPIDAEHIKFVSWSPSAVEHPPSAVEDPPSIEHPPHKRLRLPYELFREEKHADAPDTSAMPKANRITLVLWVGEADVDENPLASLLQLSKKVSPGGCLTKSTTAVVGPATSHLYVRLLHALAQGIPASIPAQCRTDTKALPAFADHMRFYSYGATISNDAAKLEVGGGGNAAWSTESVVRVIGGDDELVRELVNELGLRNVNERAFARGKSSACDDLVVLLVEADSTYARNLGRELEHAVAPNCKRQPVRTLSYFRGIDGQLPNVSGKAKKDESPAALEQTTGKTDRQKQRDEGDHAAGRSQYDYLQRLVDRVIEINAEGTKQKVRAIGILGNDVYDKLLILEAMRARIRDAVYFTTDLDARFLDRDQSRWTRNLLVASHFGLELDEKSQSGTPAFRSVYQTAAYLATRLAVGDGDKPTTEQLTERRGLPYRFQIGRTRAVDLPPPKHAAFSKGCSNDCGSLRAAPVHEFAWPSARHSFTIGALALLVVLLTTRANRWVATVRRPKGERDHRGWLSRGLALGAGALVVAVSIIAIGSWIAHESEEGRGEPFVLLEGVSAWLSFAIRGLDLVAALVLAIIALVRLRKRADEITSKLGLAAMADTRATRPRRASDGSKWTWADKRRRFFDWLHGPYEDFTRTERAAPGSKVESYVSVSRLWNRYLRCTSGVRFWSWIALATAVFAAFAYALERVDRPFFPHRGQSVAVLNDVLWSANAALLWATIFWIVFEARACVQLLNRLSDALSSWPTDTLAQRSTMVGVPEVLLVEKLDFDLIVRAAERINFIVYIPFVQIVLLGFAFHPLFGDTELALPLVIIALVSLGYAVYAMIALRRAAERAKCTAIAHYRANLLSLEGAHGDAEPRGYAETCIKGERPHNAPLSLDQLRYATRETAPAQVQTLIEEIEATRRGPFQPLLQQPFVKAMLLPFGGLSTASLLEPLLNSLGI